MPPRRPPGRSGRDIDGWWPPPSTPIAVEGGLQARSQRGRIGDTWWSQRFIAVLESFGIGSRLQRGKRYARAGQVLGMEISPGRITASVQGSRAKPYRVFIETNALTTAEWDAVEAVMASSAIFVAMLLADEMPEEIEEAFATSSVSLFPASANELDSACSCPDWENPCKHIAAVFFLLAEAFDRDPFFIFAWRGRSKEELLTSLRARRRGSDSSDGPNPDAVTEVLTPGGSGGPWLIPGASTPRSRLIRCFCGEVMWIWEPSRFDHAWPSLPIWYFVSSTLRRSSETQCGSPRNSVRSTRQSLPVPPP